MKGVRMAAVLWALSLVAAGAQVSTTHIPAKLVGAHDPGCIAAETAPSALSPADLGLSVLACMAGGQPEAAAKLLRLSQLRGAYDERRLADGAAVQANTALAMDILGSLDAVGLAAFEAALNGLASEGADHEAFCAAQKALPPPAHDPAWMAAYGVRLEIAPGFDPEAAWAALRADFLQCQP